ncbi:MAG: 5'-methylthioadenosine/adenosylhomocysteine nucleosidase [Ruminococcaceae bacterium]|nr:5'-methylthioadenosine/adenosylhomocysteine nucleosidase [Oscillospiraceae bacterium]
MIGIICAMNKEACGIIERMAEVTTEEISGVTFNKGKINGKDCVVAVCGIGKVFAALCAQTMILRYSPSLIINSGVAGGLHPSLKVCDITVATSLVQHDMDTSAMGDPKGLISGINIINIPTDEEATARLTDAAKSCGINVVSGVIATGDKFIASDDDKKSIVDNFSAIACEMEGGAIAQVCYVNKTPVCVMRAISDGGDDSATLDYPTFAKLASEQSVKVIMKFFE